MYIGYIENQSEKYNIDSSSTLLIGVYNSKQANFMVDIIGLVRLTFLFVINKINFKHFISDVVMLLLTAEGHPLFTPNYMNSAINLAFYKTQGQIQKSEA